MSYLAACVLLFASLIFIARPSLSAPGPEPGMVRGGGWAATYGGADIDWAYSIQETRDGGYIVASVTQSFGAGETDAWVLRLRPDGSIEWQKSYGGGENDYAYSIQQTTDGGYIIAGETQSLGVWKNDAWVFKLGPDGTVEWQKTYGGADLDEARSVQQTSDGGYVVAGKTESFGDGDYDLWVLRLKPNGKVEWQKTYGGVGLDTAYSIQQTSDGGYIVIGWTNSFGAGDYDAWILKLTPDGTVEWQKTYGSIEGDIATSVQQTSDEGYLVVGGGGGGSPNAEGADVGDILILKLRSDGTLEWQKTYGGIGWDEAISVQQTIDGGYIVGGWVGSPVPRKKPTEGFEADLLVLKLEADGTVEWQKTYGGSVWDSAHSIHQTTDGGYIVAGITHSLSVGKRNDIWVLKLNDKGLIAPSCDFIRNTPLSRKDYNVTVETSSATGKYSWVGSRDSSATVQATNASARILCP